MLLPLPLRARASRGASIGAALLLAACAAEPPLVPPVELTAIKTEVRVERLWAAEAGASGRRRFTPFVIDDAVIVADKSGEVISFSRDTGKRRWRVDLDTELSSGVAGADSQIYVSTAEGVIQSLDTDSGKPGWSAPASSEVLIPVSTGYGVVVVRSADGRIVALEPDDGDERWSVSYTPPALTLNGYSQPLLLDGGALVGLDDGRLVALNLANGREIWESVISVPSGRSEVERLVDVDANAHIDESAIFIVNYQGKLARLEPERGQIVWSVPFSSTAGLTLLDDRVVVIDDEDTVHAVNKENGRELWTQDALRGRRLTPPGTLGDGRIVVADLEGFVHVLDGDDGRLIARHRVSDKAIRAAPIVYQGIIYVLASDGSLVALRPQP